MIGEMYRFSGVKAIEVPGNRFDEMAELVEEAILDVSREHGADVRAHNIPVTDDWTTRSVIATLHYGNNVSPF